MDRSTTPRCGVVRETLSARLDGEDALLSPPELAAHLDVCTACAGYQRRLADVTRRVRVVGATPVPDLTSAVLAAVPAPGREASSRARRLRWLVALAGFVQLALAVPALAGWVSPDLHLGRDLGALQLALAVGLLFAAWQPSRAAGVLPVATVVALGAVATAVVDVTAGATSLTGELPHLSEVAGVLVLWALRRAHVDTQVPPPRPPGSALAPAPGG